MEAGAEASDGGMINMIKKLRTSNEVRSFLYLGVCQKLPPLPPWTEPPPDICVLLKFPPAPMPP